MTYDMISNYVRPTIRKVLINIDVSTAITPFPQRLNNDNTRLFRLQHKCPRPKSMCASHGKAQRGSASSLPSSLSSATAPPVASSVVPAGDSATNASAGASSARVEVADIIGEFNLCA
jgi:hypothetical protein